MITAMMMVLMFMIIAMNTSTITMTPAITKRVSSAFYVAVAVKLSK